MPEGTALGGGAVALNAINYGLMIVCLVLVSVHVTTFESPFITVRGRAAGLAAAPGVLLMPWVFRYRSTGAGGRAHMARVGQR